jgi:hypothetical protein
VQWLNVIGGEEYVVALDSLDAFVPRFSAGRFVMDDDDLVLDGGCLLKRLECLFYPMLSPLDCGYDY